jgi:protease I
MPTPPLQGKKIAILATDGYEQVELLEPKQALEVAGAQTFVLAPKTGRIQGYNNDVEKADDLTVDIPLALARPDEFDGVFLPGGCVNADTLRMVPEAQAFVRRMDEQGKPLAVICHAGWLLVSAGLVGGRTLTGYYTIRDDVRNAGGRWLDREVVRDRNWVSSRDPHDLPAFMRAIVELFAEPPAA